MLAIALATRGRPEILLDTIRTTMKNSVLGDTRLYIAVDDDDQPTIGALSEADLDVTISIGPREDTLGGKYNRIWRLAPRADAYLVMVDYAPHITYGFDRRIRDAAQLFPDGIGVVYGPMVCTSLPAINVITRRMAEIMEGIYPERFPYSLVDLWLDDIAQGIGRVAYAEVEIDRSRRQATIGWREPAFWATWYDDLWPEREAVIRRLIKAMHAPEWHKTLLLNRMPHWRQRSCFYNDMTRWLKTMDAPSDARYERIKAAALDAGARIPAITARQKVIGIGMVSGDMTHVRTRHCLMRMRQHMQGNPDYILGEMPAMGSVPSQGQNNIFHSALRDQADYVLLLDSDMIFPHDTLDRLLAADKDIIGAVYRARQPPYRLVGFPLVPPIAKGAGLVEMDHVPSGLMLVKREVLERMPYPWMEEVYGNSITELVGHDVTFCRKARELGFGVWTDMQLSREVGHLATIPITPDSEFTDNDAADLPNTLDNEAAHA